MSHPYNTLVDLPPNAPVFDFQHGTIEENMGDKTTGIGAYGEERHDVYRNFYHHDRTVHMGVDLFVPAGTPVRAFTDGRIHSYANREAAGDYGATILCHHDLGDTRSIFALYGHLSLQSLVGIETNQPITKGDIIGHVGTRAENGGWPPHLHFQLSWVEPDTCDMPGVVRPEDLTQAIHIYPDPATILNAVSHQ